MKISELIAELEKAKGEYGDIVVHAAEGAVEIECEDGVGQHLLNQLRPR